MHYFSTFLSKIHVGKYFSKIVYILYIYIYRSVFKPDLLALVSIFLIAHLKLSRFFSHGISPLKFLLGL